MNQIKVHGCVIGDGMPKICIPIVAINMRDVFAQARALATKDYDIIELRADWFENVTDPALLRRAVRAIRGILGNVPMLFTFRTKGEGGQADISMEEYKALYQLVIEEKLADMIDLELFLGDEPVQEITAQAKAAGIPVVISNHDFHKTPDKQEILSRLHHAEQLGADILKIALMPQSAGDVLTLLEATEQMSRESECPLITMSMGKLGMISRMCGELVGSAVTFGSAGRTSAPGQIEMDVLHQILYLLHDKTSE